MSFRDGRRTEDKPGWDLLKEPKTFPELEEERHAAERVKHKSRILAILDNPRNNGFAGVAVDEERALSDAYSRVGHAGEGYIPIETRVWTEEVLAKHDWLTARPDLTKQRKCLAEIDSQNVIAQEDDAILLVVRHP